MCERKVADTVTNQSSAGTFVFRESNADVQIL